MKVQSQARLSFLPTVLIALLGSLMGLDGGEFRPPVLAGPLGYLARQAVALNLVVSQITSLTTFVSRGQTLSVTPVLALWPVITALIVGAVMAAFFGTALVHRVTNEQLERVILVFWWSLGWPW